MKRFKLRSRENPIAGIRRPGFGVVTEYIVTVDDEDAHHLRERLWRVTIEKRYPDRKKYVVTTIDGRPVCLSRLILGLDRYPSGDRNRLQVRYIDGDPLNNRRANLQIVRCGFLMQEMSEHDEVA